MSISSLRGDAQRVERRTDNGDIRDLAKVVANLCREVEDAQDAAKHAALKAEAA